MSDLPPPRPAAIRKTTIAVTCGLVAAYMLVRAVIYSLVPEHNAFQSALRDLAMDVPRLFFLFVSWRYARRFWSYQALGIHKGKWKEGLFLGICLCLPHFVRPYFFATQPLIPMIFFIYAGGTVVVGFFEEVLFRGLLFQSIREHFGWRWAAFGSTFAFTLFHIQAQPLIAFPTIIFFGFLSALMRAYGVSLFVLIAIHIAFDITVDLTAPLHGFPPFWLFSEQLYDLYLIGMYWMGYRVKLLKPTEKEASSI